MGNLLRITKPSDEVYLSFEESLRIHRALGDRQGIARSLAGTAQAVGWFQNQWELAREMALEARPKIRLSS